MRDKQSTNIQDVMLTKRRQRGWRCLCVWDRNTVCLCVCVLVLAPFSESSLLSYTCVILWFHLRSVWVCRKKAPFLANVLFLLPTRFDFSSLSPPSFPGFHLPPTVPYLFFTSVLLVSFLISLPFLVLAFTFCFLLSGCWGLRFLAVPISLSGCLTLAESPGR